MQLPHSPNSKTPGPDGYSAEYYKILLPDCIPIITNLLNAVYINSEGVDRFLDSRTVFLSKPNMVPTDPQSYHSIALGLLRIKIIKLLTKILANRLQTYLPGFLNPVQQDFIKKH